VQIVPAVADGATNRPSVTGKINSSSGDRAGSDHDARSCPPDIYRQGQGHRRALTKPDRSCRRVAPRQEAANSGRASALGRADAEPGRIDGVRYLTHETTILFAALDIALARSPATLVLLTSTRSSSPYLQHDDSNVGARQFF
jgi:hypothetical protein